MSESSHNKTTMSRRQLIQGAAATAVTATIAEQVQGATVSPAAKPHYPQSADQKEAGTHVTHSVCLGCNARCGTRQVVKDGRLQKISGNPYHPYNSMGGPINYDSPVQASLGLSSPVCGKAHDAVGYVYNNRRITRPLKRAGKRGEGTFEEISWEQLIEEIGHGGELFAHCGESRIVPGLADCLSDEPIDPQDAYLGSQRNGFVFMTGRLQSGRKEFIDRFVKSSAGSANRIGHTDICGLGFRMGNYIITEGKQVELKADPWSAEYILVFGANVYEALQPGINTYGATLAQRYSKNEVQFTIVDPRAQNASVHAHDWVPIIPGRDGAFAMAMIRWIVENDRHNSDYLTLPNSRSAKAKGFPCYANATHLVIDDPDHPNHGKFLRPADVKPTSTESPDQIFMVLDDKGGLHRHDAIDRAVLEAVATVTTEDGKPLKVATAFSMMKRSAQEHSLTDYSRLCGIPTEKIIETAKDFTSHGTRSAVCQYHGAGNYTNGSYGAMSVALLNVLIGSIGVKGGYLNSGGGIGSWKKGKYDLSGFTGKQKDAGVKISRERGVYEKTTEYRKKKHQTGTGYPARRPWPTFTKGGLSVEALNGIDARYPYGCKVLFTYFYNPVFSTPGGYRYMETLKDTEKVPLHVSIDIGINESNIYADYIIPDVTYLEGQYGWLTPHAPAMRFTGVRAPGIEPLTQKTRDGRPYCLETFLIDLAVHLDMPGFGTNAIPAGNDTTLPLMCAEDFYLRAYANIAKGAGLPDASREEVDFVNNNYPLAKFRSMLTEKEWRQVCYMLVRGGVFKPYEEVFEGDTFLRSIPRAVLYNEKLSRTRSSITGVRYPGTISCMVPEDSENRTIAELDNAYPFSVVTYKMNVHTQSRTSWHRFAMELFPENRIQLNVQDAKNLNVRDGDTLLLRSASNRDGVTGHAEITDNIRPGCIGISFHYGHTQLGASPVTVKGAERVFMGGKEVCKGDVVQGEAALGRGVNPNMLGRLDDKLGTPLVDVLAGIPDFSSTRVTIEKTS